MQTQRQPQQPSHLQAAITEFLRNTRDGQAVPNAQRLAYINAHRDGAVRAADTLEAEMSPAAFNTDWQTYPNYLQAAVQQLYAIFGQQLPAAFYRVFQTMPALGVWQDYRQDNRYLSDEVRTLDATVHAMALGTPMLMTVQAVLSQYGLQFVHLGNCGCCIEAYNAPAYPLPDLSRHGERLISDYYGLFMEEHARYPQ